MHNYSPGLTAREPRPQQLLRRWWQCARVSTPVGSSLPVRYRVTQQHTLSHAHSPFRVVAQTGREVDWINRYLDQQRIRGMADSTLRSYAHDLLHFLRWWAAAHQTSTITQQALTESTFLDYIRFQVNQNPPPAAQSINRRVGTAERAMRREYPEAARLFAPGFQNWYWPALAYRRSCNSCVMPSFKPR